MSWAKFDDEYDDNPKCRAAGKDGRALDSVGIRHCAKHLTDGLIPDHELPLLAVKADVNLKRTLRKLIEVGRWHGPGEFCGHDDTCRPCPPGHHVVHDYLGFNPTAESARRKKQARAEAGRRGGQRSRPPVSKPEANGEAIASANGQAIAEAPGNPVPVTHVLTFCEHLHPPTGNAGSKPEAIASTPDQPQLDVTAEIALGILADRDLTARQDKPQLGPVRDTTAWWLEACRRRYDHHAHTLQELRQNEPRLTPWELAERIQPAPPPRAETACWATPETLAATGTEDAQILPFRSPWDGTDG